MKILSILAIYLLFWSMTLLVVLPIGVRTSEEEGEDTIPGQAESAPHRPRLLFKFMLTSVISAVFFLIFYANYVMGWIGMADILPNITPPMAR